MKVTFTSLSLDCYFLLGVLPVRGVSLKYKCSTTTPYLYHVAFMALIYSMIMPCKPVLISPVWLFFYIVARHQSSASILYHLLIYAGTWWHKLLTEVPSCLNEMRNIIFFQYIIVLLCVHFKYTTLNIHSILHTRVCSQ